MKNKSILNRVECYFHTKTEIQLTSLNAFTILTNSTLKTSGINHSTDSIWWTKKIPVMKQRKKMPTLINQGKDSWHLNNLKSKLKPTEFNPVTQFPSAPLMWFRSNWTVTPLWWSIFSLHKTDTRPRVTRLPHSLPPIPVCQRNIIYAKNITPWPKRLFFHYIVFDFNTPIVVI